MDWNWRRWRRKLNEIGIFAAVTFLILGAYGTYEIMSYIYKNHSMEARNISLIKELDILRSNGEKDRNQCIVDKNVVRTELNMKIAAIESDLNECIKISREPKSSPIKEIIPKIADQNCRNRSVDEAIKITKDLTRMHSMKIGTSYGVLNGTYQFFAQTDGGIWTSPDPTSCKITINKPNDGQETVNLKLNKPQFISVKKYVYTITYTSRAGNNCELLFEPIFEPILFCN